MLPPAVDYLGLNTSRKCLEQLCRKAQAIRERSEEIRLQAHQSRRTSDAKLRECQTRWKLSETYLSQALGFLPTE